MVEWTASKIAMIIIMIILIILLVFFLYTYLSPESSAAGAIDTIWGGIMPS